MSLIERIAPPPTTPFSVLRDLLPALRAAQARPPRRGGAIELIDGNLFHPLDPDPALMTPEVIAAGLANMGRFGGQCRNFYSVAQHSVLVAALAPDDVELKKWGLAHDAEEAFGLPDLPSPVKPDFPDIVHAQDRLTKAIATAHDLDLNRKSEIKPADRLALAIEARVLKAGINKAYWESEKLPDLVSGITLVPLSATRARKLFLDAWREVFYRSGSINLDWVVARGGLRRA